LKSLKGTYHKQLHYFPISIHSHLYLYPSDISLKISRSLHNQSGNHSGETIPIILLKHMQQSNHYS
jgi:hypothetical protein